MAWVGAGAALVAGGLFVVAVNRGLREPLAPLPTTGLARVRRAAIETLNAPGLRGALHEGLRARVLAGFAWDVGAPVPPLPATEWRTAVADYRRHLRELGALYATQHAGVPALLRAWLRSPLTGIGAPQVASGTSLAETLLDEAVATLRGALDAVVWAVMAERRGRAGDEVRERALTRLRAAGLVLGDDSGLVLELRALVAGVAAEVRAMTEEDQRRFYLSQGGGG